MNYNVHFEPTQHQKSEHLNKLHKVCKTELERCKNSIDKKKHDRINVLQMLVLNENLKRQWVDLNDDSN